MIIKIKSEEIYNNKKSDFPLIEIFERVVILAISKCTLDERISTYGKYLSDSDFIITPEYNYSFSEEYPALNIEIYVNDDIYISQSDNFDKICDKIKEILNRVIPKSMSLPIEIQINAKSLFMQSDSKIWRESPKYQINGATYLLDQNFIEKIWLSSEKLHIFITHKTEIKSRAHALKKLLSRYGISSFVAHDDIDPSEEWLDTIEKAIFSCDALIAMISEKFSESNWTDQEIGIAIGRQIPVYPIKLEKKDPYGFIGKYQAFQVKEDTITKLIQNLLKKPNTTQPTINSLLLALSSNDKETIDNIIDIIINVDVNMFTNIHYEKISEIIKTHQPTIDMTNLKVLLDKLNKLYNYSPEPISNILDEEIPF